MISITETAVATELLERHCVQCEHEDERERERKREERMLEIKRERRVEERNKWKSKRNKK